MKVFIYVQLPSGHLVKSFIAINDHFHSEMNFFNWCVKIKKANKIIELFIVLLEVFRGMEFLSFDLKWRSYFLNFNVQLLLVRF